MHMLTFIHKELLHVQLENHKERCELAGDVNHITKGMYDVKDEFLHCNAIDGGRVLEIFMCMLACSLICGQKTYYKVPVVGE